MDFNLTSEQQMMLDTIRKMGKRENFTALAVEIDKTGQFPHELMGKYAEMGLIGMTLSEKHGGGGRPSIDAILAIEELAKFSPMIAAPVFESNIGPVRVIDNFGTEEQKNRIIPGVCKGELSVSVSMTEPEAGSDLTALRSKLVEDENGGYILNGRKTFITGGGFASHYLVYARFGDTPGYKGIGGVIVEKDSPGFTFGRQEEFMGLRGMPSCDLVFENVKVPKENVVVNGGAFSKLMTSFDVERCGNSAMCLGTAAGAVEAARLYAMERHTFGRPICEFQDVQNKLVNMSMKLDAARLLVYRAAVGAGRGFPSMYESAMGKCYANEMVAEVTDEAMLIFGGYGYSKEFPVERMHRDALAWRVAGGTTQMLRLTMASIIFARRFDQRAGK